MQAIMIKEFVKDLSELQPSNVSLPKPKGAQDVLVKVTHVAVTHVDTLYARGLHQNNKRHMKPPFTLGTEFSGIVTSAPSSRHFRPGDRVFGGDSAYAEYISLDEKLLRKVPSSWSNVQACAVGASGAVSYGSLMVMGKLKAGETALILGASGGLGVMAVQIAKAVGAKVIATVGSKEKAEVIRRIGADAVVNYKDANWEDQVKALTDDGEGVHVVYDAIGAIESSLKCLRYRGRVVIVGFVARDGDIEKIRANRILLKSASVIGYRFGEDGRRLGAQQTESVWEGFMKLVNEGSITPVIYNEGEYNGLHTIPRAMSDLLAGKTVGRSVVTITEESKIETAKTKL
ncbi:hypothetical protein BDV96DRAFT_604921 [Lophiotrema nucula]|uniref:Enoyl reductase (ER) domain-containing protein n=1 Tax=Lophiotrema nucula TaxID=690887 RepID=A0A6A5YQA7_9PLEO|nr:hypothetical protein BDV96DRAFT_604921 [Lophiotrema nucula]